MQDWLSYYIEVSDYSKAVGMCITPEEEAGVDEKFEAKRVAYVAEMCKQGKFHVAKQYALNEEEIAKCDEHEEAQQEASRLEWFDFYLCECKFDKAGELACTTEEVPPPPPRWPLATLITVAVTAGAADPLPLTKQRSFWSVRSLARSRRPRSPTRPSAGRRACVRCSCRSCCPPRR